MSMPPGERDLRRNQLLYACVPGARLTVVVHVHVRHVHIVIAPLMLIHWLGRRACHWQAQPIDWVV